MKVAITKAITLIEDDVDDDDGDHAGDVDDENGEDVEGNHVEADDMKMKSDNAKLLFTE